MARTITVTTEGVGRTFTISPGVGPTGSDGPSNITTATATDLAAGFVASDGDSIIEATTAQKLALPVSTAQAAADAVVLAAVPAAVNAMTTITGSKTFSGQVELTGQAATGDDSSMSRSLSDTRYGELFSLTEDLEGTEADSTTFVDSTNTVTLPAGTYTYKGHLYAYTDSTTAGINADLTGINSSVRSHNNQIYTGISQFVLTTLAGNQLRNDADIVINGFFDAHASIQHVLADGNGWFTITTAQEVKFRIGQRGATDASNPAILSSAYIEFRKLG